MYNIEKKDYGISIKFIDSISLDEILQLEEEIKKIIITNDTNLLIDFVDSTLFIPEVHTIFDRILKHMFNAGLHRTAYVLKNSLIAKQFKIIARQTGANKFERYFDAEKDNNIPIKAHEWLKNGIDPYL